MTKGDIWGCAEERHHLCVYPKVFPRPSHAPAHPYHLSLSCLPQLLLISRSLPSLSSLPLTPSLSAPRLPGHLTQPSSRGIIHPFCTSSPLQKSYQGTHTIPGASRAPFPHFMPEVSVLPLILNTYYIFLILESH